MRTPRLPVPSRSGLSVLAVVAAVLLTIAFLWGGSTLYSFKGDLNELKQTNAAQDAAQDAALDEANRRLTEAGEQPVETPPPVSSVGPSVEEIRTAVDDWFVTHDLSLTPGYTTSMQVAVARYLITNPPQRGQDGRPPTEREIASAVAVYVSTHPPADGKDGLDGSDGSDGADGQDGTDGKDGRGISGTSINADGHLIVSYTDGASDDLGRVVGADGQDGQSPFPFTWKYVVENNPVQSTTYTVTCTVDGCTTTSEPTQ